MEDLPSHGGAQHVVARLSTESKASPGAEIELTLDLTSSSCSRRTTAAA